MWTEFEWENRVNVNNPMSWVTHLSHCHLFCFHWPRGLIVIRGSTWSTSWKQRTCHVWLQRVLLQANVTSCLRTCMPEVSLVRFASLFLFMKRFFWRKTCLSGEDALANLSVERTEAGTITGHVRIRSKTQGIALSLGDRITMGM